MKKYQSVVRPYTCAALIDEFYTCFNEFFKDEEFSFSSGKSKCLDLNKLKTVSFGIFSDFVQKLAVKYKYYESLRFNSALDCFYINIDLSSLCEFYDAKAFRRLGFSESVRILRDYPAVLYVFDSVLRKCGLKSFRLMECVPYIIVDNFVFKYKY